MIESILDIDRQLFILINQHSHDIIFDAIMPVITNSAGAFLLIAFLVPLFIMGGKKGKMAVLIVLISVLVNDLICGNIIKPLIGRARPCKELEFVRLLVSRCAGFSFPAITLQIPSVMPFLWAHLIRKHFIFSLFLPSL
jgi:undecaprenyl-diphosphatase